MTNFEIIFILIAGYFTIKAIYTAGVETGRERVRTERFEAEKEAFINERVNEMMKEDK